MKKRFLAAGMCAVMATGLLAGCGNSSSSSSSAAGTTAAEEKTTAAEETTTAAPAEAEELPEAFAHLTFDEGAGESYKILTQVAKAADSTHDGAFDIVEATEGMTNRDDYPVGALTFKEGKVGTAAYLDGTFGIGLGLEATNTDTYTISFWMNADRLADYAPTLQIGYNIPGLSDATPNNNVTWMNITQTSWGVDSAKIFPVVWSRNEASDSADHSADCWPWMYAFDNEIHGVGEWIMVTVVCSGEEQTGTGNEEVKTVGAQYYLNGQLVYDSNANYTTGSYFEYTWDATLAPNIMQPGDSTFESYFGINYWDYMFKGYVDDLYVYDTALTAGQVLSLYEMAE